MMRSKQKVLELRDRDGKTAEEKLSRSPRGRTPRRKNTVFELENALDGTSSRSHTSREIRHHTDTKTLQNEEQKRKETEEKQQNQGPESQHQAI